MKYPYVTTTSGLHYHLVTLDGQLTQESSPIDVRDIASHLARINRFTGATSRPYSVAEHSLLCADLADRYGFSHAAQLACLMHDAHEAYLNDLATPIKQAMRTIMRQPAGVPSPWDVLEETHAAHLAQHLGIDQSPATQAHVKEIDTIALAHEQHAIGPPDKTPWPCIHGISINQEIVEKLQSPDDWLLRRIDRAFLDRFHWLKNQIALQMQGEKA